MATTILDKNEEAIVFVTNIDFKATEDILWELFVQTGPVVSVFMPRNKMTSDHQGYAFIEFKTEVDAEYSLKILQGVKLYTRALKISKASKQKKIHDIGANIFIGNLDPSVDERKIYDTLATFGQVVNCRIMRDPVTTLSKGFAFVSFDSFEAADNVIEKMNGQYYANKILHIEYALKKDTKGERHGSAAERLLAANRPASLQTGMVYNSGDVDYSKMEDLIIPEHLMKGIK